MALFFAVALGIAALCVLAVYRQSPEPREKFRPRNFDRTVAEGMRLWNPKAGVDSVRFDSCRIDDRKDFLVGKQLDVSLRSLFEGKVSLEQGTFPVFWGNGPYLDKTPDSTCGGMFPGLSRTSEIRPYRLL